MAISRQMRDVLIDHIDDRPVKIMLPIDAANGLEARSRASRFSTTRALVAKGFLRQKLRHTYLTEEGRAALAAALADWADAIVRLYGDDALPPLPPANHHTRRSSSSQASSSGQ